MKAIKFIFFSFFLVSATLFFTSCSEILDKPIEVTLGEVPFDIPITLNPSLRNSNDDGSLAFTPFSGQSDPISIQSDMFENLKKYNASAIVLVVSDVKVKIITTSESGTTVKEFTSNTLDESAKTLFSYGAEKDIDLNKDFSDAKLKQYVINIVSAIQNGKTVTIDVAGLTDIVPSEVEGVDITVYIIPTLKAQISLMKE